MCTPIMLVTVSTIIDHVDTQLLVQTLNVATNCIANRTACNLYTYEKHFKLSQ